MVKKTIIFDDPKSFCYSHLLDGIIRRYVLEQKGTSIRMTCNGKSRLIDSTFDVHFFDVKPGDEAQLAFTGPNAEETFSKLVKFGKKMIHAVDDGDQ